MGAKKKAADKPERVRGTVAVQLDNDLAQMVRVIASHDGVSQADVLRDVIRPFLLAQYARVQTEMSESLKRQRQAQ